MRKLLSLLILMTVFSCQDEKEMADLIVTNANIYTVDANFSKAEAFAVQDGKIIAIGSSSDIEDKYQGKAQINAEGKTILPGLIDAHCHFLGLGYNQQAVDLVGTTSFDEMIKRVLDFQNE